MLKKTDSCTKAYKRLGEARHGARHWGKDGISEESWILRGKTDGAKGERSPKRMFH
jgi:hypothetical protein